MLVSASASSVQKAGALVMLEPQIILGPECQLGEGLLVEGNDVLWVDIETNNLFHYNGRELRASTMSHKVTVLLARSSEVVTVASSAGLANVSLDSGEYSLLIDCSSEFRGSSFRTNDGCQLKDGTFLVGIMHRESPDCHKGAVFHLSLDGTARCISDDIHIPNTFIELDNGGVLISDSLTGVVYLYRCPHWTDGKIDRSIWYQVEAGVAPDGGCLLPDGTVAIAMWDAGCIRLFDQGGAVLRSLHVTPSRPTNCKYSRESSLLWVTSASLELGEESGRQSDLDGRTFAVRV